MRLKFLLSVLILILGVGIWACSSSKRSKPTFNLMFEPPPASGFSSGSIDQVRFGGTVAVNFTLPTAVTLSGQVTDGTGTAMNNVDVGFRTSTTMPEIANDTTDPSGNYSVVLPAGPWVAVVDSNVANLGKLTVSGISVVAPGPVTQNFQFASPVSVSGTVFELGGPAIGSAQVKLTGAQSGVSVTLTANGSGFYTTTVVPDTYEAEVTPAGASATTHLKEKFPSIVVSTGTTRDFSLQPGVTVSGVVRDNLGQPLLENTDVKVVLASTSNFFAPAGVTANSADGTYSIGPVPSGSITFELEPPGASGFPKQQLTRSIVGPTTQTEDFGLAIGVVLSGTIVQNNGTTPEPNVEVKPIPTNGTLAPDDDDTDGSGVYQISLFPGTYTVNITPDPTNLQMPEVQTITITGATTLNVTLTLGATLTGTVTNGGTPEPDIKVEIAGVTGASNVTNGSG
ncbi:MAG: carboxypeptidase-like regulatory domain-containing protein, partial [Planctomycetota bacterium]